MGNIFPGKLANNDTVATTCLRSTSGNVSGPDNVLSPLRVVWDTIVPILPRESLTPQKHSPLWIYLELGI